jgi:hypothetical protein
MSQSGSRSTGLAPSRDEAFVVHLTRAADESEGEAHGRIEHVTSGRFARFDSADELLRFMRRVLAERDDEGR